MCGWKGYGCLGGGLVAVEQIDEGIFGATEQSCSISRLTEEADESPLHR